jgi:hypothetical protein
MEGKICVAQPHTRVQKVARCYVCVGLPFGFGHYRGAHKTGPYQDDPVGSFPILFDYELTSAHGKLAGSALWRMQTVLRHHDRVRGIAFAGGASDVSCYNFNKFFKATSCSFPMLEILVLHFVVGYETLIPKTFLGGPDLSDLHLRHLESICDSFPSISRLLSSASSSNLTDLLIDIAVVSARDTSLLACLQRMSGLRSLSLSMTSSPPPLILPLSQPPRLSISKDIVPLSKLSRFCYVGPRKFLDDLVVGLSAPSLRDVNIEFREANHYFAIQSSPSVHLPRFFNEIEEHYYAIHVDLLEDPIIQEWVFRLSLLTQSECIGHCKPRFELGPYRSRSPESIMRMSVTLSTKLTTVEELRVTFDSLKTAPGDTRIPWHRFYLQFPGVKALRTDGIKNIDFISRTLVHQAYRELNNLPLPSLEEIDLGTMPFYESQRKSQLAAFQPVVGRVVYE